MTATSANGLALMWEIVYIASGLRCPIVMTCVNRALSAPINIHCDHSDSMGARDSGWIQLYSENSQEAYDNMIHAVRIAEHPDVQLPVMVCLDGFIISAGVEVVSVYDDDKIKKFVGEHKPRFSLLDTKNPVAVGALDLTDYYFEHKRSQAEGMHNAPKVIAQVAADFKKTFGTEYGFTESYKLDDAEIGIIAIGSTIGTAKSVVDECREKGIKVGLLKIRVFRPFPEEEIVGKLKHLKAVAVMDRAEGMNAIGGPLFNEIRAALYNKASVPVSNYIYGLGGRDVGIEDINKVIEDLRHIVSTGIAPEKAVYVGVRE